MRRPARRPPQFGQKKPRRAPYSPRLPKPQTEDDIAFAVAETLALVLPPEAVWTAWDFSKAGRVEGARKKRLGVKPGWPDLGVFWRGIIVLLELKRKGGVRNAAQRILHPRLAKAGFPVTLCRSVDDVLLTIRNAGIPLRGSNTA